MSSGTFYIANQGSGSCAWKADQSAYVDNMSPFYLGNNGGGWNNYFRFPNVTIPYGSTVTAATFGMYIAARQTNPGPTLRIQLDDSSTNVSLPSSAADGATRYGYVELLIEGCKSTVLNEWQGSWVTASSANGLYLYTRINTMVNTAGWASGNAMGILIEDNANTESNYTYWNPYYAYTYFYLTISWTAPKTAAPTGVTVTGGVTKETISWSAVTGASSYNIYWGTSTGVTKANGTKITGASSGYEHTGRTAGTTYYYIVTAVNVDSIESDASSEASAIVLSAPPTGMSTSSGINAISVSWNSMTGASSYNLYWKTSSPVTKANGTKETGVTSSFNHTGRTPGTTYYYVTTSVNASGESAESSETSGTAYPAAPATVMATGGTQKVTITFSSVTGASSYNIYWKATTGVTKANGTKITGVTSPYEHTGRADGTAYFYIVTAVAGALESADSGEVSSTTAPAAPTGVTATGGTQEVTISWTASTGATSYNLRWSGDRLTDESGNRLTDESGNLLIIEGKITGVTSPYSHTGLADNATYYYQVTALNAAGESGFSSEASAKTVLPPTGLTATGGTAKVDVSWSPADGAASYNLYWDVHPGVSKISSTKITGVTSPYEHTGRSAGVTYYYAATAVNSGGTESGLSNEGSAITTPAAPSPSADGGSSKVILTWSPVTGASSYNAYWAETTGVTKSTGTKIENVTSPYQHTGRTIGVTYYYVMTSVNATGESADSTEVNAQASGVPDTEMVSTKDQGATSIVCIGSVTTAYGHSLIERGFCCNLTGSPTVADTKVHDHVNALGEYTLILTGLLPNRKYYVRSYAESAEDGVGYSMDMEFTTNNQPKTFVTGY